MDYTAAPAGHRPPPLKKRRRTSTTTVDALGNDVLSKIFAFLDLIQLIRCSAVCKSWSAISITGKETTIHNPRTSNGPKLCRRPFIKWVSSEEGEEIRSTVINKLKLLQIQYHKQHRTGSASSSDASTCSERFINMQMEQIAMDRQRLSLQNGPIDIFQWKGHSIGINQCRMKMGLILSGGGDKVMRLWSAESCRGLDEYVLPDKAPLIDFDFDEGKVVGLVGTRICIWRRIGTRDIFSSRDGLFTKGLCMRYVDPQAVVGCEDGRVRVFDMYSRKVSQIIKMHHGPVSSISFTDEQLIVSGSSLGSISMSDLSSDQRVDTLGTASYTGGIKTLCLNPSSYLLFAGSSAGYASCWDLRTMRSLWNNRVSPNVLYSMHHLRNDKSTLVVGGIDGVLRILDQDSGEVLSSCIMEENGNIYSRSRDRNIIIEKRRGMRLSEDDRIDLMPNRPPITCLAVGMQKVVTIHSDRYARVWKFRSK